MSGYKEINKKNIIYRYNTGQSIETIAKFFKCGVETIEYILVKEGFIEESEVSHV
jgi:hypothetical protein